ncbi:MAG TPA: hypothetical protein VJ965_02675 [Anaerolineales bacterium]|nr:hypothetical protein [Anaerolineales bacterium]
MKDDKLTRALVLAFGLYQTAHLLSNIRGAFVYFGQGRLPFPALPPAGGFDPHLVTAYVDMAFMDSFNAMVSFVFIWGYFSRKPWRLWLGSITLTLSLYAGILFNLSAYQTGAWSGGNLPGYLLVNLTYIPVAVLWGIVMYWGFKYLRE